MIGEIAKWVLAGLFIVFAFAVMLAEANRGPHWVEEVEIAIGGWLLRAARKIRGLTSACK